MTKKRVHEVAKEIGIENKELLEILKNKNIEVKSHMSSVEEHVADEIKKDMATKAGRVSEPEPKKNIVRVFRPQNTKSGGTNPVGAGARPSGQGARPPGQGPGARPQGPVARPPGQGVRPAGQGPRPQGPGARPPGQGVRPPGQGVRPAGQGARPPGQGVRPVGPGSRPPGQGVRPQGPGTRPPGQGQGVRPGVRQATPGARPPGVVPGEHKAGEGTLPVEPSKPLVEGDVGAVSESPRPIDEGKNGGLVDQKPVDKAPTNQEVSPKDVSRDTDPNASDGKVQRDRQGSRPPGQGARPVGQGTRPPGPGGRSQGPQNQDGRRRGGEGAGTGTRPPGHASRPGGPGSRPPGQGGYGQRPASSRPPGQGGYGQRPAANRPPGQGGQGQRGEQGSRRPWENRDRVPSSDNNRPGGRPAPGGSPGRKDKGTPVAPIQDQNRSHRNKAKDKEKEFKKNEVRGEAFGLKSRKGKKPIIEAPKPQPKVEKKVEKIKQIIIPEMLTIKELADAMKITPSVIIKKLFLQGRVVTVNQEIDYETAEEIAMEFEVLCEKEVVIDVIEELLKEDDEDESKMVKRPPVVCVMGHVDHGKTSLLDAIRDTNVMDREAGGITQHIGAYTVTINDEIITFLDTPGHEAFTSMRMRGANSTDIAILVVAADDGVMPQTVEAISHAKAAGVEIIVAINKIDKPGANVERVKQELTEHELVAEDWGGSTVFVPVSAKTREGITDLLEMILLTSEVLELKANPERSARGLVIEGLLDKGKGSVATVLVQKGTLRVGDSMAAGSAYGKVRAMMDYKGKRVKTAGPSQPVEILGLNGVPKAGEVFVGCETEKEARSFAETFISQNRVKMLEETKSRMSLDDLFTQIKEGNLKELNIIVKADVQGSVEALRQNLLKLSNEEVVIKVIHGGVGAINESDVILASTSNAIIIGFNVRPDVTAKETVDREGVDLRLYSVIYNAIDDVEAAMKGMLDPIFEEKVLGHAEIRQIFKASGIGNIAGSYILDGTFERGCKVRVSRGDEVIYDGDLASLKRFKDDVKEVRAGYECGLVFANFNDVQEEDRVEAYKMVEVERK